MFPAKRRIISGEAIIPFLTFVFGIAFLLQTKGAPAGVMNWPWMIISIMALFWIAVVIRYCIQKSVQPPSRSFSVQQLILPMQVVGLPLIYLFLLPHLGFAVCTTLFLMTMFAMLGGKSWASNFGIALAFTLFLQISLIYLLHMTLPRLEIGSFLL